MLEAHWEESGTLAAEATLALNLWMYVIHEFYDALADCVFSKQSKGGLTRDGLGKRQHSGLELIRNYRPAVAISCLTWRSKQKLILEVIHKFPWQMKNS